MSQIKLTKKGSLLLGLLGAVLLTVVAVGSIWYVNNRDTQVAVTDSSAVDCPYPQCESGGSCHNPDDTARNANNGCTYTCSAGSWINERDCDGGDPDAPPSGGSSSDRPCGSANSTTPGTCPSGEKCCEGGADVGGGGTNATCKLVCGTDGGFDCSSCVGSCGATGCSTTCDDGHDPHSCNIWNGAFACEGQSGSGCGDAHPSNVPVPSPLDYANNEDTWCKTYQFDSNAANGACSVVFVGDHGATCVTHCGQPDTCNPDDLDWDCTRPPPPDDEPDPLVCNDSGCTSDSECPGNLICTDDGICRNPECPGRANCECPIIPVQAECNEACDADSDCNGALVCSNGMCRESQCTNEPTCICPTGEPVWKIEKSGSPSCVVGKETYAQVFYTVVIRNSGDANGILPEVVDTLDGKVQSSWVDVGSIDPTGEVIGNTIIWSFSGEDAVFTPGEEMVLSYTVNVPEASFGEFTNIVEGHPREGGNFSDDATVPVSCVVPVTGIFDSTQSKIIGSGVLLLVSAVMVFADFTDKSVLKLVGKASDVSQRYSKVERKQRAVNRSRGKFEDDL